MLETELATFTRLKETLLKSHEGKFALIKGDKFVAAFDTAANAYEEGIRLYEKEPFLVKRISAEEEVYRNQALYTGVMHARF